MWYHRENEEPWDIPIIDEVDSGKYMLHGWNEFRVHSHIQDIPENGKIIFLFLKVQVRVRNKS